jgi:hypothetical protein
MINFPAMLVSESEGWDDVDQSHHLRSWYFQGLTLPLSLLPPLLYAYAETMHPGVIFQLSVPALTTTELIAFGVVFYFAQILMVSFLAMVFRRMALARDHDPGDDAPYALAAISCVPLWLSSLAMLVPSRGFSLFVLALAVVATLVLIRHGARPLLHIADPKTAHYVADTATLAGAVGGVGLILVAAMILSMLLVQWTIT